MRQPFQFSAFVFWEDGFGWQITVLCWTYKRKIPYENICKIEMLKGPVLPLSSPEYYLKVVGYNSSKPLLQINLTASGGKFRSVMVDAIATYAPQAALNDLASRVRKSYFG